MSRPELGQRLIAAWREAAADLGIPVTAPVEVRDAAGEPFWCEAFIPDFGSPAGGLAMTRRTERRVRHHLRSRPDLFRASGPDRHYVRKHFIDELVDWGWFGPPDARPDWWPAGRN